MELTLFRPNYYRVKRGQQLCDVARAFCVPLRVLAAENDLSREPEEGQLLLIPEPGGHLYTLRGGESMTLLCGSREKFVQKNRTEWLYPARTVWI